MLSRSLALGARRALHGSAARRLAQPAAAAAAGEGEAAAVLLNLSGPLKAYYNYDRVALVNLPGVTGEYGVAPDHAATISELRSGTVQVFKSEGAEPTSYFIAGGMAFTHPGSKTDVACADICQLKDVDGKAAQAMYAETKRKLETLAEGSKEQAEAMIELEVYEAACVATGTPL